MTISIGRASGRLDLLGGVADYSGALVLEVPTRAMTTVTAEPADSFQVGGVDLGPHEIDHFAKADDAAVRAALASAPAWTRYLIGVAVVLVRHNVLEPPRVRLVVDSEIPIAMGASSSAALELATARALGAQHLVAPLELALMCQEAENRIVGAPCGVMDQVAVAMGEPGAVLPILCRPASVQPCVPLPHGVEVVGWPSGAPHDVAGDQYGRARAASFMGKRIAEDALGSRFRWTSELPESCLELLPEEMSGDDFVSRWGRTDDSFTEVQATVTYPVRAATGFGVREHLRTTAALKRLRAGDTAALPPLLAASHAAYTAMGLGHLATDAIVAKALARPGVHAARTSGGGSGGCVVVLCDRGALDDVDGLIR